MATLTDYVYSELLRRICDGEFQEGVRLPSEIEFSKIYKVSRPVIRDALARLRNEGFVYSRKGAGSFVTQSSHLELLGISPIKNWLDIKYCFEFRASLEGEIAFKATQRCNAHDKINIQKAYDGNLNKFSMEGKTEMDLDLSFHLAIAEATHNRFYYQALKTISIQIINGMSLISSYFKGNKAEHNHIKDTEHGEVLRAILCGDAEMARAAMQLHIFKARDWLTYSQEE